MKYTTIFFDWGDTLASIQHEGNYDWVPGMLQKLYENSYRLGIISNTHRYQDAHYIRKSLEKMHCARYIECVVSSALYGYHKPDIRIFQKAVQFMDINPTKAVMVGDSAHCDGGSQILGMKYIFVNAGEKWDTKLYDVLENNFDSNRKLTRICEFGLIEDKLITKMNHLSEPLKKGDSLLLNDKEYTITHAPFEFSKDDVINPRPRDKFIEFKVKPKTQT